MQTALVIAAIVGMAAAGLALSTWTTRRAVRRHMAGREVLSHEVFGRTHYPGHEQIASRIRAIMQRHIAVDLSRLVPSDDVIRDLRMDELDSMATAEFLIELEEEYGISIPEDAAPMRTVDDIVHRVIGLVEDRDKALAQDATSEETTRTTGAQREP